MASTLAAMFGGGSEPLLRLAGERRQHGRVDLLHGEPCGDRDRRPLDRVHLAVEHLDRGLLARQHLGQRIIGEHDHQIDVAVVEGAQRCVLVADEALVLDELVQLVAPSVQRLFVDRSLLADEQRVQSHRVLRIAGAEQQQQHERSDHEQDEQARLAEDLDEFLADERLRTDGPPPWPVRATQLRRHDRIHREVSRLRELVPGQLRLGQLVLRSTPPRPTPLRPNPARPTLAVRLRGRPVVRHIGVDGGTVASGAGVRSGQAGGCVTDLHDAALGQRVAVTFDDPHERLVVVDDVLGRFHEFEPDGIESAACMSASASSASRTTMRR